MIEAQDLTRRYGARLAVDGISFSVGEGEILGLLGPNGAGKTTTIRMLTGFLPPTSGRVTVAGHDLSEDSLAARREIGYLPESVALYPEMRVEEYLAYRARLTGLDRATARESLDAAIERCLLGDVRRQVIATLSKGYRQRVGLAQAILHRPRVLILDEPTVGLDPKQIVAIRALIRDLGQQTTLVLSTHILPEVELLCDRILIIDRGRIAGEGTPAELRARLAGAPVVRVTFKDDPAGAPEALASLPGVAAVRNDPDRDGTLLVEGTPEMDPREEIFHLAVAHRWVILGLELERASLEDVFLGLTREADAGPVADGNASDPSEEPDAPDVSDASVASDDDDIDPREEAP